MEINYAQKVLNEKLTNEIKNLKDRVGSLEDRLDALTAILGVEILSDEEIETCYHPCDDCKEQGHCVFEEDYEEDEEEFSDPETERILDEIAGLRVAIDEMAKKLKK